MPRVTITVPEKNAQPYRFQLDRQVVTLGRGGENDIVIDSASVSVHHAEMHRIEGGYELRDIGSTNGIKCDGLREKVVSLRSGTTVKIGDVAFDFLLADEECEALARERPPELPPITREPKEAAEKPSLRQKAHTAAPSGGSGFAAGMIFLILAAAAFCAGMAVRYEKDTGGNLLHAIKGHPAAQTTPVAPASPESDAE